MAYYKSQGLNSWNEMAGRIYDGTQNYYKSKFEIHCHLTEVSGAFGKLLFKKNDLEGAFEFLPKMFIWGLTLFRKVNGGNTDIEDALFTKYPGVCSYCLKAPCVCWSAGKPQTNVELARQLKFSTTSGKNHSINDFQLMFRKIYGESWGLETSLENDTLEKALKDVGYLYIRLIEELSETAEAIRFHHLYPSNFNNELADYFAWWFALASNFNRLFNDGREILLAEDIIWTAYPGFCMSCGLLPCDCRPGPVRELLSKPALNDLAYIDGLTQADNRTSFDITIKEISQKKYPTALPIACIRIDVDDFKKFNNEISHTAGDNALVALVTTIRQKIRPRDKVFRIGGDEFAIFCQDFSQSEAEGMMNRVADALKQKKIKGKNFKGEEIEKTMTLSIGIANCDDVSKLEETFNFADEAAIQSKNAGKNRVTIK